MAVPLNDTTPTLTATAPPVASPAVLLAVHPSTRHPCIVADPTILKTPPPAPMMDALYAAPPVDEAVQPLITVSLTAIAPVPSESPPPVENPKLTASQSIIAEPLMITGPAIAPPLAVAVGRSSLEATQTLIDTATSVAWAAAATDSAPPDEKDPRERAEHATNVQPYRDAVLAPSTLIAPP